MADALALSNLKDICVAGITPFTTIDFPGRLAGVLYLQGCSWRCVYCHNPEFWTLPKNPSAISFEKVSEYLLKRKRDLDGIVFSGGEPLIHNQLCLWMKAVKDLGFQVALHTGGAFPERLREVLPFCNWVGMDIKSSFEIYDEITQVAGSGKNASISAEILISSGVDYEFRTTYHPKLFSEEQLLRLAQDLSRRGCKNYFLQRLRPSHCPDKRLRESKAVGIDISAETRMRLKELIPQMGFREQ